MINPIYYAFAESLWPPHDNSSYMERVRDGYFKMQKSSVVIAGLARNLGNHVVYAMNRIGYLGCLFKNSNMVLYTNDNEDETLCKLSYMENSSNLKHFESVKIISENLNKVFHGSVTTEERYRDMAYYRNKYLEYVKQNHLDCEYLVVLDTDVKGGFSWDGLAHSISWFDELDATAIGSNSLIYENRDTGPIRLYYDCLAFRRLNQPRMLQHNSNEINLLSYNRGENLIRVNSCFGGLCIYRLKDFKENNFIYEDYDCDHVTLHDQMNQAGLSVFMNPSQIVLYSSSPYCS